MAFNVRFLIRKNKKDKKGTVPIYCRISTSTHDRVEYSVGIRIDERLWLATPRRDGTNGLTRYIKGSIDKIKAYNITLNKIEAKVQSKYNELLEEGIPVTAQELKSALSTLDEKYTVISLFKKLKDRRKAKEKMESQIRSMEEFLLGNYNVKDLPVQALLHKKYLGLGLALEEWGSKKGWAKPTTKTLLGNLKSAINIAVGIGYIAHNPILHTVKIKSQEQNQKETLTHKEIQLLEKCELSKKVLRTARDVFLLQCLVGLSYADLKALRQENITKGIDGNNWIIKPRGKTGVISKIPLLGKAQKLLDKLRDLAKEQDKFLPIVDISDYNKYLKKIMQEAGIKKSISTHCARHTFATLLSESGSDMSHIKRMTGHSNTKMTEH